MSTPIAYPFINGNRHDFSSIELKAASQLFVGFKGIAFKRTRTRVKLRGNHPDPLGKTRGTNDYDCSLEMYIAEWFLLQTLLDRLAATQGIPSGTAPGSGYGDAFFLITVQFFSEGFDPQKRTIFGNTLDEVDEDEQQGADPLTVKLVTNPLKIIWNDLDDLGTTLQAPPTT